MQPPRRSPYSPCGGGKPAGGAACQLSRHCKGDNDDEQGFVDKMKHGGEAGEMLLTDRLMPLTAASLKRLTSS